MPLIVYAALVTSVPPLMYVNAGAINTSRTAMMPTTMSSSTSVNPPSRKATAGRGALKRSTRDAGPRQSRCLMLDVGCWMYSVLVILSFDTCSRKLSEFGIRHSFVIRHSFDIRPLDLVIPPQILLRKNVSVVSLFFEISEHG